MQMFSFMHHLPPRRQFQYRIFSECTGRDHEFFYNVENFYDDSIPPIFYLKLPWYHPYQIVSVLFAGASVFIVPLSYGLIYRYHICLISRILKKISKNMYAYESSIF